MRWLEFTHEISPTANDANDYQMLVRDLAALIHNLATALPKDSPDASAPATDFPQPIQVALSQERPPTVAPPQSPPPGDRHFTPGA